MMSSLRRPQSLRTISDAACQFDTHPAVGLMAHAPPVIPSTVARQLPILAEPGVLLAAKRLSRRPAVSCNDYFTRRRGQVLRRLATCAKPAGQPWPRDRGVLVLPLPGFHPCIPFPSPAPNVAPPAFFVAMVLFRAVRFAFFATDLAPARAPAFWSRLLDAFATRLVPPVRSEAPRAFWRLVPPPRLFPVFPPREFEPTLLLGVALGMIAVRFRCTGCVHLVRAERGSWLNVPAQKRS